QTVREVTPGYGPGSPGHSALGIVLAPAGNCGGLFFPGGLVQNIGLLSLKNDHIPRPSHV
ncbi:MAG: hypothetical protein AAGA96_13560, partial [Verrucomicrobiota bacterium]